LHGSRPDIRTESGFSPQPPPGNFFKNLALAVWSNGIVSACSVQDREIESRGVQGGSFLKEK
jgi:hypothetical protein